MVHQINGCVGMQKRVLSELNAQGYSKCSRRTDEVEWATAHRTKKITSGSTALKELKLWGPNEEGQILLFWGSDCCGLLKTNCVADGAGAVEAQGAAALEKAAEVGWNSLQEPN
jgi:hypothetical protein